MNNKKYLTPLEIAEATVETGYAKANKSSLSLLLLGILAGAFIAFGAIGATSDPRKGFEELREALHKLDDKNKEFVVFGSHEPKKYKKFGFKKQYLENFH